MDIDKTGVYRIRNTENGRLYVGSASRSFRHRWKAHKNDLKKGVHCNIILQRAWDKYGEVAFAFEIIELCHPIHCVAVEQVFIDFYRSADPEFGYNIATSAGSRRGVKASDEVRSRMSAAQKSSDKARRHVASLSEMAKGRKRSDETKAKISAANKGKKRSPETIALLSRIMTGTKRSPESVEKSAASRRGLKNSPEHIAKVAAANRGRRHSPETIEKMSIAKRGKRHLPESIEKIKKTLTGRKATQEHIEATAKGRSAAKNRKMAAGEYVPSQTDRVIEIDGVSKSVYEWAKEPGSAKSQVILYRLNLGWTAKEAVYSKSMESRRRLITVGDETRSITEWANLTGVPYRTIHVRINKGWTVRDAVWTPIRSNQNKEQEVNGSQLQ